MGSKQILPGIHETVREKSTVIKKCEDGYYRIIETVSVKDTRLNKVIENVETELEDRYRIAKNKEEHDLDFVIEDIDGMPMTIRFMKVFSDDD